MYTDKDSNLISDLRAFVTLVIPEFYVPTILYIYHDSLLAGHETLTRMYFALKGKFYADNPFSSIK